MNDRQLTDSDRSELHAILDAAMDGYNANPDAGSISLRFGPEGGEGMLLLSLDGGMTAYLRRTIEFRELLRAKVSERMASLAVGEES